MDRFSRKENQLNNDKDQVEISHYVHFQGHILILGEVIGNQIFGITLSEASEDRMSVLIQMLKISVIHNFATVKPKTLKLCKMIHLAALVYVISLISLKTWPNKKLPDGHISVYEPYKLAQFTCTFIC